MKKLFSLLSIFLVSMSLSLIPFDAEAAKFGGSRSFGKSYRTAPAQQQSQPAYSNNKPAQGQPAAANARKGMMGGLLGGLLAGGLLAWMFGSGAFQGLQIMDILLMAGLAFLLFKLFRGMSQQRTATATPSPSPFGAANTAYREMESSQSSSSGNGFSDVPFNLPPGFDLQSFLNGARDHYRTLQQAWNQNDLQKMREYVSPSLYEDLVAERKNHAGEQHTEVMFVDAQLVRADRGPGWAQVSVKFTGRYRDSSEQVEADINEIWHLERDLDKENAPWFIVGIEQ